MLDEREPVASLKQLDVLTVVGNGASVPVLERAGVRAARILLAVTSSDEVNLISSLAASRLGVKYTVTRTSNPDYYARGSVLSFGRYRGWALSPVAAYDRNYLEWLSRTMAGRTYTAELKQVLSQTTN